MKIFVRGAAAVFFFEVIALRIAGFPLDYQPSKRRSRLGSVASVVRGRTMENKWYVTPKGFDNCCHPSLLRPSRRPAHAWASWLRYSVGDCPMIFLNTRLKCVSDWKPTS